MKKLRRIVSADLVYMYIDDIEEELSKFDYTFKYNSSTSFSAISSNEYLPKIEFKLNKGYSNMYELDATLVFPKIYTHNSDVDILQYYSQEWSRLCRSLTTLREFSYVLQ